MNQTSAASASQADGTKDGEHYGPGMGLSELDPIQRGVSIVPTTSRTGMLTEGVTGTSRKKRRVTVPGSEIQPYQGGRGRKRVVLRSRQKKSG